jgi:hypothetical protein
MCKSTPFGGHAVKGLARLPRHKTLRTVGGIGCGAGKVLNLGFPVLLGQEIEQVSLCYMGDLSCHSIGGIVGSHII